MLAIALFLVVLQSSGFVRPDYPPPSEDGHEYYGGENTNTNNNGGASSESRSPRGGGMSFVGDWSDKDWQVLTAYNQPKCLDIPSNLTLCRNIGYDQMRLPNLLEHDTLREATQQAASWVRLAHVGCHPDTQVFLCSLFAPVCLDQPVWPCRSLCDAVRDGCEKRMLQYGFPWPDMLRCDRFPSGNDLCIGIRNTQETEDENEAVCSSCALSSEKSSADVLNRLCQADFVIRAKVEQNLVTGNDLKISTARKKKVLRAAKGSLKAKELRTGVVFLEGGAGCDCPALDTVNGRRSDDHVIIAGNRTGDRRLVASFVHGARSKGIRSVLRDLREKNACSRRDGRTAGGKHGEKKRDKKRKTKKKNGERLTSLEVGREQEEEERGEIESKNQKVRNKGTKVTVSSDRTSGKDRNKDKNNRQGNSDNRKGNGNDNAGGNRATTESQVTASDGQRETPRQKNERIVTSPRPTKKVTTHRRRPV